MDNIIRWMENNNIRCYSIFGAGNEKRSNRICKSVEEAITEFSKDYEILPDGKYHVKGMDKPGADKAAVRMNFEIGFTGNINNSFGGMGHQTIEQIRAEAYNQARKDIEYELLDKRIKDLEHFRKVVTQVLIDLTDGDESNDDKATDVLSILSGAKEKFENAQEVLKDFKF